MLFSSAMFKPVSFHSWSTHVFAGLVSFLRKNGRPNVNKQQKVNLFVVIYSSFLVFVELWCSGPTYSKDESYPLDKSSGTYWIIQMVIHAINSAIQSLNNWSLAWWCSWFYCIRRCLEKGCGRDTIFALRFRSKYCILPVPLSIFKFFFKILFWHGILFSCMVWPNWPKRNSSAHYSLVTKIVMQTDQSLLG